MWSFAAPARLRTRLLLLVLLAMLPLVGMLLTGVLIDRENTLAAARRRVVELAQLGAEQQDDTVQEARTVLMVLSRVPQVAGSEPQACHRLLKQLVADHPRLATMSVTDRQGQLTCSSVLANPKIDISDRGYVQRLLRPGATGYDMSDLVTSKATGTPTVFVGLALPPHPGSDQPIGVLSAGLNLDWLASLSARVAQGSSNVAAVLDSRDGTILARYPNNDVWAGRRVPASAPVVAYRRVPNQVGMAEGLGPDGVERIYGFAPLPGADGHAIVVIGLSRDQVLAQANRRMALALGFVLAAVLVAASATWLAARGMLVRPGARIMKMMEAVGTGDLRARVALQRWHAPELRLLADTLNTMAADFSAAQERLAESEARFRLLAGTDGLTGLANRRMFNQTYVREWRRAARECTELSLLMLDVDHFKRFNDRYGHVAGDDCLRRIAMAISGAVRRPGDIVARLGGEEFAVLLPRTGATGAAEVAEQVRGAVAACALQHSGNEGGGGVVTVSAGVMTTRPVAEAEAPALDALSNELPDALVKALGAADKELYAAKCAGRNCVRTTAQMPAQLAPMVPDDGVERRIAELLGPPVRT